MLEGLLSAGRAVIGAPMALVDGVISLGASTSVAGLAVLAFVLIGGVVALGAWRA